MASNTERQAAYRKRRDTAGANGDGEKRLNSWIDSRAMLALERIARYHQLSKRDMLERLILAEDEQAARGLNLDSPEWEKYYG